VRKISALLAVILVMAFPVLADINQNAGLSSGKSVGNNLHGQNAVEVSIAQEAWNYGSGDINQDINVDVTGNIQTISQDDNLVLISDPAYAFDVNNTMKGLNLIRLDLSQYANNSDSGSVGQSINVLMAGNIQVLEQNIDITMIPWMENNEQNWVENATAENATAENASVENTTE
jgi:hypothetical protein